GGRGGGGSEASCSFVSGGGPEPRGADLADDTPQEVKLERLAGLQRKIDAQAGGISVRMVGTRQQVLVEGASRKNATELTGRTANKRTVNFRGGPELVGRFVDVTITEALTHTLGAEVRAAA